MKRKHANTVNTVGRGDVLAIGPVRLVRFRTPDSDPYAIGFNQHDDRNYTLDTLSLVAGGLVVQWRVKAKR